jgi:hypothetical protein
MKWELQYLQGTEWVPMKNKSPYNIDLDQYNVVAFEPVSTSAVRLAVRLQRDFSGGILEWKISEAK